MQHAARDREVRIERAFADLDGELGNIDAIGRRKNRGALRLALRDRPCEHIGRQPVDRRARSESARIDADHPAIIRSRCHVLRLGGEKLRASGGEPRFGLRYVGARYFADVETVARLLELFGQNFDVAPLQIEHRLIAQQIHISGRGIEQHLLLGDTQGLARRVCSRWSAQNPIGQIMKLPRATALATQRAAVHRREALSATSCSTFSSVTETSPLRVQDII